MTFTRIYYAIQLCDRFSVNLTCKTSGNIALHFNPRLDRGYIVRNTKVRGSWGDEETCSPAGSSGCIFRRNTYMHLMIFCTNDAFQVIHVKYLIKISRYSLYSRDDFFLLFRKLHYNDK